MRVNLLEAIPKILATASLLLAVASCQVKPEPIRFGNDTCHFCKMTIMDYKFGGELVTKRGKVYKFDDINCLAHFYHADYEPTEDFIHKLVIDYANPGHFLEAETAFYVKSDRIRSPMASEIAAFADEATMTKFKAQWGGIYLTWQEVLTQYK
ncbi:MAG: nitrous oxide reductase accessory protein NosL [Cyclobacteriaceae bacterium]|jgi:copper chaperone NosL|nr:nitrous oxide reductase accessory protein NosL [Cyclobacteriaceae bacterium]